MAGSTAEITWTSNDAQVLRTFQKVEKGFDDIARRMDRVESATKKTTTTLEKGFDNAAKKVRGVAMALIGGGSLLTAVDMVKRANEEMIRQADEAAKKYDDLFRKFRVQAGLGELEGKQAQDSILAVAHRNAVHADVAKAGASGLVGAGFSTQAATGAGLDVLLRTSAAMNASGKPADTEALAKQAAAYFTSQGMESTPANLQKLMENSFALRAGAFELSDLAELGKHGAVFRGKLSQEEQLAAFGSLVDAMPSAEAGTSLRNIVSRLSTADVGRTSKQALEKIGLKPTDVDLVGENFDEALGRLEGGLKTVPEEQRAGVLKQLFEEAGVAPASILLNERRGKYARYQAGMASSAGDFATAADIAQSGRNAAEVRMQLRAEQRAAERYQQEGLIGQAMDEEAALYGASPARRTIAKTGYNTALFFGASPEGAADFAYGTPIPFADATGVRSRGRAMDRLSGDQSAPIRVEVINQPQPEPQVTQPPIRGMGR